MAFPADYTLLVEYDLPTITGTHTNFVALLKYDDFNVGDALDFWDNGGGDLRISDDINGTTQLPIEVVEFDKVGLSAQVWVKIPSAFTGKTIYLWGNNTGDTQPAVADAYGRNAVWSSSYYSGLKNGTATDSSGNTSVTVGSGSISSRTGVNGLAVDFDGSTELSLNTPPSGIGDYYLSAWVLRDSGTETAFYGTARQAPDEMDIGMRYDSSGFATSTTNVFKVSSNSTAQETTPSGTCPQSQWIHTVLTRQGATSKFYIDGVERASWNSGSSAMSPSSFFIATGVKSPTKLNGGMQSLDWGSGFKSEDFAATEYDNQSTSGAWGTPTRVGGGGATYTINIDNLAATGSFTNLSLLHNKKLNLDTISATANFDNVDLHYNRKLQLNALAATGQLESVSLRHNKKLTLDTLTASGQFEAVTLDYNQGYSLTLGTLAATGGFDDVSLRHNRKLNLGTLSATGQFNDVTLNYTPSSVTYTLALETLTATAGFDDVALRHNRKLNIEPIVATAYFDDVALLKGHKLNLNSLSSTATFNDVELLHNRVLSLEPITADANFQAIALNWSGFVEQRITNFSMRYKDNPVKASYKAQPFTIKFKE